MCKTLHYTIQVSGMYKLYMHVHKTRYKDVGILCCKKIRNMQVAIKTSNILQNLPIKPGHIIRVG